VCLSASTFNYEYFLVCLFRRAEEKKEMIFILYSKVNFEDQVSGGRMQSSGGGAIGSSSKFDSMHE